VSTTYTITGYAYEELSEKAQQRALSDTVASLHEDLCSDHIGVLIEEEAHRLLGTPGDSSTRFPFELGWSLSYSQGDGVAMYGKAKAADVPNLPLPKGAAHVELTRRISHYDHYNSFDVEVTDQHYEVIDAPETETALRDMCKGLERFGYDCIENETSEAAALDWLRECAGDVFHADGSHIPWGVLHAAEVPA